MSTTSAIEWTDTTWNPVVGCRKVSPGCANCYAQTMTARQASMAMARKESGGQLGKGAHYLKVVDLDTRRFNGRAVVVPEALDEPLRWKKPRRVFVNSMSDLFHEDVPKAFITRVFATIERTPRHKYQILTKRPEAMLAYMWEPLWHGRVPQNAWFGTSVENGKHGLPRIDVLRQVPAAIRFLSCEPLLEDLGELNLDGIHWVIAGGESGPGARPIEADWVRSIRDQCQDQGVAFFFKQWGGVRKKENGRELDGRAWDEMPEVVA